jgi:hypothetical protein
MPAWVARRRTILLYGSLGLGLGVAFGYLASPVGMGAVLSLLPLLGLGILGGYLLLRALVRRSFRSLGSLVALAGAAVIGGLIAPDAPGAPQSSAGTATASSIATGQATWNGAVSCEWRKGWDDRIQRIEGLAIPVDDPALLAKSHVTRITIWSLTLPPSPFGWSDGGNVSLVDVVVEGREPGAPWPAIGSAPLSDLSPNSGSGTANVLEAGLVVRWTCEGGP